MRFTRCLNIVLQGLILESFFLRMSFQNEVIPFNSISKKLTEAFVMKTIFPAIGPLCNNVLPTVGAGEEELILVCLDCNFYLKDVFHIHELRKNEYQNTKGQNIEHNKPY